MGDLFNSRKHAIEFLKRRGCAVGIDDINSLDYLILRRPGADAHEIGAIRYLRNHHNLYSTIDKQVVYSP